MIGNTAENAARIGSAGIRVRQTPGDWNALGRVKFVFPNAYNVYMHDTPAKAVFESVRRDVSHGCIRVADPEALADWVLRDQPEWPRARRDEAMAGAAPTRVEVVKPVRVMVVYGTAVAERDGDMHFFDDIYGHDRRLARLLAQGYPYPD